MYVNAVARRGRLCSLGGQLLPLRRVVRLQENSRGRAWNALAKVAAAVGDTTNYLQLQQQSFSMLLIKCIKGFIKTYRNDGSGSQWQVSFEELKLSCHDRDVASELW